MRILEIILPVLVMLVLGMACRKLKLLTKSGIDNMKLLVTNIMLPVAFNETSGHPVHAHVLPPV